MRISDWSSDVCSSDLGCDTFIEIGPQPVLCGLGRECAEGTWIASLRRGADDVTTIRDAAATAWMRGAPVEWRAVTGARPKDGVRSEEHTSELPSLMRTSDAVFCLKKKKKPAHY